MTILQLKDLVRDPFRCVRPGEASKIATRQRSWCLPLSISILLRPAEVLVPMFGFGSKRSNTSTEECGVNSNPFDPCLDSRAPSLLIGFGRLRG